MSVPSMRPISIAFAFIALSVSCATAQTTQFLAPSEHWSAWAFGDGRAKVCYTHSEAIAKAPGHLDHGRVSLFVRRHKGGRTRTKASLRVGYTFAPSAISATV